ncbi:MAG: alpha-hydroxy acid oxidase [Hyphomicrobiaceae bacterium]
MTTPTPSAVCLADYEDLAAKRLDAGAWAYFSGGAADELTLRWNRKAYDRLALLPRVLNGGPGGSARIRLFGRTYAHPIFVAPVAHQGLAHPEAERATAMAAAAQGAGMVLSTLATVAMETAASAGETCRWFQLYMQAERDSTLRLVRRAEAAGFEVLVVTADAPISGVRNREHRAGFHIPSSHIPENLKGLALPPTPHQQDGGSIIFDHFMAIAPRWQDIEWLRSATALPIVVKGIMTVDDASRALDAGVNGIVVSNHGGRTLDTVPATIDVLPGIAEHVAGRVPLLVDGGIRRGTDVLKAVASGAAAVLIGRPIVYGLAVNGAMGVAHVLRLLRDEFEAAMALTGVRTVADISPRLLRR